MITLEYVAEQKSKYQNRRDYFSKIGFDGLATEFQIVVDLIGAIEDYIKEQYNGED